MNTPRRIPTDEIEVGRWYRVEDAVPAADGDVIDVLVLFGDGSWGAWSTLEVQAGSVGFSGAAWMLPGLPDSLPPREAPPKRFTVVYRDDMDDWTVRDAELDDEIIMAFGDGWYIEAPNEPVTSPKDFAEQFCALLNAGHEALEGA